MNKFNNFDILREKYISIRAIIFASVLKPESLDHLKIASAVTSILEQAKSEENQINLENEVESNQTQEEKATELIKWLLTLNQDGETNLEKVKKQLENVGIDLNKKNQFEINYLENDSKVPAILSTKIIHKLDSEEKKVSVLYLLNGGTSRMPEERDDNEGGEEESKVEDQVDKIIDNGNSKKSTNPLQRNPVVEEAEQQEIEQETEVVNQSQPTLNPEQEETYGELLKELRTGLFNFSRAMIQKQREDEIAKISALPNRNPQIGFEVIPSLSENIKNSLEEINEANHFNRRKLEEREEVAINLLITLTTIWDITSNKEKNEDLKAQKKKIRKEFLKIIGKWNLNIESLGETGKLLEVKKSGFGGIVVKGVKVSESKAKEILNILTLQIWKIP
jgi:hypothetical protein